MMSIPAMVAIQTSAQTFDDWEARPNVTVKYKANKNLSLAGTYFLYIDKNMTEIDKSVMAGEIGYKINSWVKAGFEYRYALKNGEGSHELRYSFTFDKNIAERWKIKYRPMLQQEFESSKKTEKENNPAEYFLSNRLTVDYDISNSFTLYLFTENYVQLEKGNIHFHKQKSAVGLDYEINERNQVGTRFDVINKSSGKNVARVSLNYTITLGYIKSKQ